MPICGTIAKHTHVSTHVSLARILLSFSWYKRTTREQSAALIYIKKKNLSHTFILWNVKKYVPYHSFRSMAHILKVKNRVRYIFGEILWSRTERRRRRRRRRETSFQPSAFPLRERLEARSVNFHGALWTVQSQWNARPHPRLDVFLYSLM